MTDLFETELKQTGCIYIIKNLVTNEYYVGQTRLQNPAIRWKEHFDEAFCKYNDSHLYCSMRKYGIENFVFQIVETGILLQDLDAKEKEHVKRFDSFEHGYNNTIGGQDREARSKLTKEQVITIIAQIQMNEKSFVDIAKDFGVNSSTISDINNGDTWYFDGIQYPIVNKCNKQHFSEAQIQDMYTQFKNGANFSSIAKQYNTSVTTISKINNGDTYRHKDEIYPIMSVQAKFKRLEINEIRQIVKLLKNTNLSYHKIERDVLVNRKTIAAINRGEAYRDILNQLGITQFPIRNK